MTAKHIIDDLEFAIDNTIHDEELGKVKQAIIDVAKQQDYWGEQQPARWITLEQELDKLRRNGTKVGLYMSKIDKLRRYNSTDV